jgi:hypothetical protein
MQALLPSLEDMSIGTPYHIFNGYQRKLRLEHQLQLDHWMKFDQQKNCECISALGWYLTKNLSIHTSSLDCKCEISIIIINYYIILTPLAFG